MKAWFGSLKKSSQIAVVVLALHFLAIFWMSLDHWLSPAARLPHPIFVRTLHPPAPMPVVPIKENRTAAKTAPSSPAPVAPKIAAAPKMERPAVRPVAPAAKKTARARANSPQPSRAAIPQKTIEEIERGLKAISAPEIRKTAPDIKLPPVLETQCVSATVDEDIATEPVASSYQLRLIETLQSYLQLPEIGEVRVRIALSAPGKLDKVEILDAKSEKNARWLKSQLPLLELPYFADFGIVDGVLNFTITFRNAENI